MKIKKEFKWHLLFIILILIMLYPIVFAISTSFKSLNDAYNNMAIIPKEITLSAYQRVLNAIPFETITGNTFIVSTLITLFKLITGILAAYSFVFLDFKGKNILYFILIGTIFIPFTVTLIPNFITISRMGLNDNILGVVLPQLADATGIFLLRQHMKGIPKSLLEVADLEKYHI